jgi:hypothetical protein
VRDGPKNSVKKGAHLGPSNKGEHVRETRGVRPTLTHPHPAREVGALKRYGVSEGESELGADFTSFSLLGVNSFIY